MALLSLEKIGFGYGRRPVLRNISLEVRSGEIVCLLGPNGSGKTTLLKIALGLLRPLAGQVRLGGVDIAGITVKQLARHLAYVPQAHRLTFAYPVKEVVLMGRLPHKPFLFRYSREDREKAMAALERLSIAHLSERPYTDISGGERQLTLIARALAQDAQIFIMDEPANGLDYGNQIRLLEQLNRLAQDGYTFVKSTHFPDHALWVSHRVLLIKQGRIVGEGRAAETINEDNLRELYGCGVEVENLPSGGRICMPRAMRFS